MASFAKNSDSDTMRLRIGTWNILCPAYKRMGYGTREKKYPELVFSRLQSIVESIQDLNPDILCLQEVWSNENFLREFQKALPDYNLEIFFRPGKKSDGCGLLYKKDCVSLHNIININLKPAYASRIMQIGVFSHVKSPEKYFFVANVHLTFPHDNNYDIPETRPIQAEHIATDLSKLGDHGILTGDFNCPFPSSSSTDLTRPVSILLQECRLSSAFHFEDPNRKFVSHHNHNNEDVGCDHILFRGGFTVEESYVYPRTLDDKIWHDSFIMSDHRCVCANFQLSL